VYAYVCVWVQDIYVGKAHRACSCAYVYITMRIYMYAQDYIYRSVLAQRTAF
jgi:hypothetical protein